MSHEFHAPVWDRGEPIDDEMMRFTVGDDWWWDRRLVEVDLAGSLAHVDGLLEAGVIEAPDHALLHDGLEELREAHRRGEWDVESGDEDVHSAIERRLTEAVGEAGKRLHTGRSRNDQVALDVRLWLREAADATEAALIALIAACARAARSALPLPGYTHLRRAMPSSVRDWSEAHRAALEASAEDLAGARRRLRSCPLGSGAGYGVPLPLARESVADALGFEGPELPVTLTQLSRGRAELAYLSALESIALDLGKLAGDLWLYSSAEFGFASLPVALTTGSSLMPHKRNPDALELLRAHCRQVGAEREALARVLADLPSGYHRDFQLLKPPLFRAHDRMAAALPIAVRLVDGLEWDSERLEGVAADPALRSVERALDRVRAGESFRDAYRAESRED
ncbi:MAG: argininosuccinate lyase [Planctomycetes bacterium]|nr:argininosuccinate lyase [Planctomycetota bacterium]